MNHIIVKPGYTRINLSLAMMILSIGKYKGSYSWFRKLSPYLLCNSAGIVVSYEGVLFISPETYKNHSKKYKYYAFLNFIAHYIIFAIAFVPGIKKRILNLRWYHPLITSIIHSGWWHLNDVNKLYELDPPLETKQQKRLWKVSILGHWGIYILISMAQKMKNITFY